MSVTGGCQCGAVRYELSVPPSGTHFCHCRMCQRAVGNVFAGLTGVYKNQLKWTKGQPAFYQSSSVAKRGFCRDCGTPLYFGYDKGEWNCVTIGSLDHPEDLQLEQHYGVESKLPWLKLCDGMPEEMSDPESDERAKGLVSYQAETK